MKNSRVARPELKRVDRMEYLVDEVSKYGKLATNLISARFAVAGACLKVVRHHSFVGCQVGTNSFARSTEELAERYAR